MVIREWQIAEGPAAGARVQTDDGAYRGADAGELACRRRDIARIIRRIDFGAQLRHMEAENEGERRT